MLYSRPICGSISNRRGQVDMKLNFGSTGGRYFLHKHPFFCYFCMITCALIFLLSAASCTHTQHNLANNAAVSLESADSWPHEESDLVADSDVLFGRLPNGVRYILKENKTPRDRVSMHLWVQVGSLAERDDEQGLAHFMEHMAFNGTTHFAPGEMVKFFQRIGMQFGPDANAHTGFSQTVYDVLLPDGSKENLLEGLKVLQDYAAGALLLAEEVEKEKNVVLAEMRTRDSGDFRSLKSAFKFEMPGTLIPQRFPIGKEETIKGITTDMVRSFYDAWYRPERMVLVLVGDFDKTAARSLIHERFGGLKSRALPRPVPDFGRFSHSGLKSYYWYNKESGAANIRIETMQVQPAPKDNVQSRRAQLAVDLANRIVQKRLDKIIKLSDNGCSGAFIDEGYFLNQIRYSEIAAQSKPENWRQVLAMLEQTLRGALQHGFTPAELSRARSEYIAELKRDVEACHTLESGDIAEQLMDEFAGRRVSQSALQRQELLAPMLDAIAFSGPWNLPKKG